MHSPRYAGDYVIINSIAIGNREVVLGENRNHRYGLQYMCGPIRPQTVMEMSDLALSGSDFFEAVEILPSVLEREVCSSDYLTILSLYHDYIRSQRDRVAYELSRLPLRDRVYTENDCRQNSWEGDLLNEIIALCAESLQPEYRMGNFQLVRITGGEGAFEDAADNAVLFGETVFTGQRGVWKRGDVLGVLSENQYPEWLLDLLYAEGHFTENNEEAYKNE